MNLAIFDLDRTLTKVGTYTPFLIFAALHRAPWRLALLALWVLAMSGYVIGLFSRKNLKEIGFFLLIGRRIPAEALQRLAKEFARLTLAKNMAASAQSQIQSEKRRGSVLMVATASPDFYAAEIGSLLGFDLVVATRQSRLPNGDYSFRILGENCYGPSKLRMVEKACAQDERLRNMRHSTFYSDSASDAPMFCWATQGMAVNPDRRLRKLAAKHGWPILETA
jgi:HAD superfamily hydrolase (TIGR01490 family)